MNGYDSRMRTIFGVALLILAVVFVRRHVTAAEEAHPLPLPAMDIPAGPEKSATLVLAGGCFWGVQGVFQHVKGVTNAVSGYAGGDKGGANYEIVSTGTSGHAESVQVTYDPRQVSYGKLLQIFFSVVHDPTQLNRQGPDTGPQYRSAIFTNSPAQEEIAKAYIAQLNQTHIFKKAIATRIEPNRAFYAAEGYHQDYLTRYPTNPYIAINDLPKIENLKRVLPDVYRSNPTLVAAR